MTHRLIKSLIILFYVLILFAQCNSLETDSSSIIPRNVRQYCGSCHIVPEPQSLTSEMWESSILPKMSQFYIWDKQSEYEYANTPFYNKQGNIPMTDDTWNEIINYYTSYGLSEESIRPVENWPTQSFYEEIPVKFNSEYPPAITAAMINKGKILLGSAGALVELEEDYTPKELIFNNRDFTHIYPYEEDIYITSSSTINPHHGPFGEVALYNSESNKLELVFKKLERPVQIYRSEDEIITSEFGFKTGQLSIRKINNVDEPKAIHSLPGSYRIIPAQLNKNEEKILITSVSQAQEGIYALIKNDKGYEVKELIRFKPEYGLSDIDIADINGDGLDDILVVNGDNADYSIIPKSYHGINVYMNRGNFKFNHAYSFKIHGATQGKFVDVNMDNKIDIIASCYFAESKEEGVVLLLNDNKEHLSFSPRKFEHAKAGNWMIMEKGDIDNDGFDDILLGAYNGGPKQEKDSINFLDTDLLLLLNQSDN